MKGIVDSGDDAKRKGLQKRAVVLVTGSLMVNVNVKLNGGLRRVCGANHVQHRERGRRSSSIVIVVAIRDDVVV